MMNTASTKNRNHPETAVHELINRALAEDVREGDATTNAIVDEEAKASAIWTAKDEGIIAGLDIARQVFQRLDAGLSWQPKIKEGGYVDRGNRLVEFYGSARAILTGERIALNIAQRMSGIATKTHRFVQALDGLPAQILDTRKTVPGLRLLDKYAVKTGGGQNHRMGLYDLAMIKDNHIVAAGGIGQAVAKVRKCHPGLKVEVETTNLQQVDEALLAGADIIMLDNMPPDLMRKAVKQIDGRAKTEASGNITLKNVRAVAQTGVDYISVGALTHSVQAFDISQTLQQLT